MTPELFRDRLRAAIDSQDMTWPELAAKSGYSASYLQRLVGGHRSNPTLSCVAALAETLQVPPAWLLGVNP